MGLKVDPKNAELLKERIDVEKSLDARREEDAAERKKKEARDLIKAKMMTEKREFYEVRTSRDSGFWSSDIGFSRLLLRAEFQSEDC